jgi:hypothetical protein
LELREGKPASIANRSRFVVFELSPAGQAAAALQARRPLKLTPLNPHDWKFSWMGLPSVPQLYSFSVPGIHLLQKTSAFSGPLVFEERSLPWEGDDACGES